MSVPSIASNRINPSFNALDELQSEVTDLSAYVYSLAPSGGVSQAEFNDLSGYVYSSLQVELTDLSTYVYNLPVAPDLSAEVTDISNRLNSLDLEVTDLSTYVYSIPPPATPTLQQVLTAGRDASNYVISSIGRLGVGVTAGNQGNTYLNISPSMTIPNTNPNIWLQHIYNGNTTLFMEMAAGTMYDWISWKNTGGLALGSATGSNADAFSYVGVLQSIAYQGRNPGITSVNLPMYATAFSVTSDERNKKDITDLSDGECLELVRRLNPKRYNWIDSGETEIGFIAQNVAEVIPEAVKIGEGDTHDYWADVSFIKSGSAIVITLGKSWDYSTGDILKIKYKGADCRLEVSTKTGLVVVCSDPDDKITEASGTLFLKGREVSDFHYIKNNASLPAILTSAIQEIDRNQRKLLAEIEILKSKLL